MGPERLDRARTVESIAAVLSASGRPPWAGAVLVRYSPRAAGLAAGAAVGLPGAPAGGRGELVFPTVDSCGRSVGAGRVIAPTLPVLRLRQREGTNRSDRSPAPPAVCGPHTAAYSRSACRARRRSRYRETAPPWFQLPWPRSRACRFRLWTWAPPRRCRRALAPVHPLHPMTAGHATRPKQGRDYRYRRPDRRRLRMGHSRSPGGAAKAVLSPSSPPPERPRPHSLAGAPGSGGGSAPVV